MILVLLVFFTFLGHHLLLWTLPVSLTSFRTLCRTPPSLQLLHGTCFGFSKTQIPSSFSSLSLQFLVIVRTFSQEGPEFFSFRESFLVISMTSLSHSFHSPFLYLQTSVDLLFLTSMWPSSVVENVST